MLIQAILTIILVALLLVTFRRARQGAISWGEGALWSLLWVAAAVVVLLPQTASFIATLFGVGRGVDAIVYAAVTLLFVLVFRAFTALDRLDQKLTDLVRRDALRNAPLGKHDTD